jgi:hypothetical protein
MKEDHGLKVGLTLLTIAALILGTILLYATSSLAMFTAAAGSTAILVAVLAHLVS